MESTNPDNFTAFSVDGHTASWSAADGTPHEDWTLTWENEAWTASGQLSTHGVQYVLRLSPTWHVRQFLLFRDLDQPDLWLATDHDGRWGEMNGVYRDELDDVTDVDVVHDGTPCTPFPLSIPIRRLGLSTAPVGTAADVTTMMIDVETLAVVPATVTYRRIDDRHWSRRDAADETRTFDVDDHGLVTVEADRFQRTA